MVTIAAIPDSGQCPMGFMLCKHREKPMMWSVVCNSRHLRHQAKARVYHGMVSYLTAVIGRAVTLNPPR